MKVVAPPICPLCGRPQLNGVLCPGCIKWQADIDGIRSPYRFEGVTREAIHQLKYRNLRTLAGPLAQMLNKYLAAHPVPGNVLVPVPLHPKRLKERGYNQSSLLAGELSKLNGLKVIENCLVRQSHTSPQAKTATVDERRNNVSEAFKCLDDNLEGRQVIIIDDVATSGATLNACAQAVKAGGAESVWGLVMAREI